jgi:DNA mismatch repair protein MutL
VTASPRIQLLPDELINQIAAGEVVERPASAVKELLENALDAGATRIVVQIEHGGKRLIRIVDNGHGIPAGQLTLAVTRHATSKIRNLNDLVTATSLGFRGEALPSIASVSHLTLRSTLHGADEGRELILDSGSDAQERAAAPMPGTSVEVTDLFYNTPARAKFLKADGTEWGHIVDTVNEVALGAPHVHFSMAHNARPPKVYPAAETLAERIRQIYPKELTEQLIPVDAADPEDGLRLTGLVARPGFSRSGRDQQKLLVNGRCIRNPSLSHGIYAGFQTNLPAGRHPVFFLSLEIPPQTVDVNVHPTKREVRFSQGNRLHSFMRQSVSDALGNFRGNALRLTRMGTAPAPGQGADWVDRVRQATVTSLDRVQEASPASEWPASTASSPPTVPTSAPQQVAMPALADEAAPCRVVGQLHNTFVLVEQSAQLRIVDQHTAHERVLFERLMARALTDGLASQRLLIPVDITLPPAHGELVEQHQENLSKLGIDIEPFGGQAFLVRGLPAPLAQADVQELVNDIADDLASQGDKTDDAASADVSAGIAAAMHKVLATIACHAAVKSGDRLSQPQMTELIRDLEQVENPHTCPHGRAVTAVLDKGGIKALFDRNWGK